MKSDDAGDNPALLTTSSSDAQPASNPPQDDPDSIRPPAASIESVASSVVPPVPTLSPNLSQADFLDFLRGMRPREWNNLYIIGSLERRVTVYDQQMRALILVRSLFESKKLTPRQTVGIVGAGFAGITAAVAAASLGCTVKLYDQHSVVVHLQSAATHRFLHPHIFDWPDPISKNDQADLPFLGWKANTANAIAEDLRNQFRGCEKFFGSSLEFVQKKHVNGLELLDDSRIRLLMDQSLDTPVFDVGIVAMGFGQEERTKTSLSYWANDDLDFSYPRARTILVSGTGDGGLIDVARAAIQSSRDEPYFRHGTAVTKLMASPEFERLGREMQKIDDEVRGASSGSPARINLMERYRGLSIDDSLRDEIKALARPDADVTFNSEHVGAFSVNSAIINRLLVYLLFKFGIVKYKYGKVDIVSGEQKTKVKFNNPHGSTEEGEFDIVIQRYGPTTGTLEKVFPNVRKRCDHIPDPILQLRLTQSVFLDTVKWFRTYGQFPRSG